MWELAGQVFNRRELPGVTGMKWLRWYNSLLLFDFSATSDILTTSFFIKPSPVLDLLLPYFMASPISLSKASQNSFDGPISNQGLRSILSSESVSDPLLSFFLSSFLPSFLSFSFFLSFFLPSFLPSFLSFSMLSPRLLYPFSWLLKTIFVQMTYTFLYPDSWALDSFKHLLDLSNLR